MEAGSLQSYRVCLINVSGDNDPIVRFLRRNPACTLSADYPVFPALGAALAGITNQGEFRRIAQRSQSMHERLQQQYEQVQALQRRLRSSEGEPMQLSIGLIPFPGNSSSNAGQSLLVPS